MNVFSKLLRMIDTALIRFLQALLLLVTASVSWQVFSRYVLNAPSSFTEELARFLLIWITLLGCAFAYRRNSHLGLDMIYSNTTTAAKKAMYYFIHLAVCLFAIGVMVIGGFELVKMTNTLGQSSPALGVDIGAVYLVIPLSGCLIVLFAIEFIAKAEHYLSALAPSVNLEGE